MGSYIHFNQYEYIRNSVKWTSSFSNRAFVAASTVRFIAFHAHATFPRVHGSGSSFRRGVYIVGHSADFRLKEGSVRAAEIGTGCKYGAGRFRSSGSCGGSAVVLRRRLVRSPFFRMRFRCPSSGPSSPACFNHLMRLKSELALAKG